MPIYRGPASRFQHSKSVFAARVFLERRSRHIAHGAAEFKDAEGNSGPTIGAESVTSIREKELFRKRPSEGEPLLTVDGGGEIEIGRRLAVGAIGRLIGRGFWNNNIGAIAPIERRWPPGAAHIVWLTVRKSRRRSGHITWQIE